MTDYPGKVIFGGSIFGARGNSLASQPGNSALLIVNSKSLAINLQASTIKAGLCKTVSKLLYAQINNVLSSNTAYFNNGFSQDSSSVYFSKSALGLPIGLNLSLEALFVSLLIQWGKKIGLGDDSKINSQWLGYGDKDGDKLYFTIQLSFKKQLTVVDSYEIQPVYTISPLDF
ncbi:hypothetical protein I8748_16465 [Nostoc sp. CENA67]|uniref:Uncharacterized protein n=1 Tax=Amazonocrinis nigriterrae CENA67 TaxID=2794033 RepID=A0A8J7HUS7_9NOST|nr:hypothetical protein [Amazonocrinis nigriterrae]MBH8563765.1 hypothetical protein [Amazonocrinis nigriterrae CENA67]